MVNHGRTLLLNISGTTAAGYPYPGEELVPSTYTAIALPGELARIRNLLFGNNPDRAMLNYRLRQLLTLVHSTELGDYLTALDSRITYWPSSRTDLFDASTFGTTVQQLAGSTTWALGPVKTAQSDTKTERLLDQWKIAVTDASSVTITHLLPNNEVVNSLYVVDGVSQQLTLPGSDLKCVVGIGVLGSGNWPTWQLSHLAKPLLTLSEVYVLLKQAESQIEYLFESNAEPYLTCRRLWSLEVGPIAYKLGAVVVALAYKINEVYGV